LIASGLGGRFRGFLNTVPTAAGGAEQQPKGDLHFHNLAPPVELRVSLGAPAAD